MTTTCFVIMGYHIKKIPNTTISVNLDDTYEYLIKPTLIKENLVSIYPQKHLKYAFRSDEVYTTQAINETFIRNIYEADIVIADITALNQNAVYELGLRHAMKPKSTIIMCDHNTLENNSFFDLSFCPQLRYDSTKQKNIDEINRVSNCLTQIIQTCRNSDHGYIDSPVFHMGVYDKSEIIENSHHTTKSLHDQIKLGTSQIENEKYQEAEATFYDIMTNYHYSDDTVICSYILASYKKEISEKNLIRVQKYLNQHIDLATTTSENALGISASISVKLFDLTKKEHYLYQAIEYYRIGSDYESGNIYCGRNYCASLLKIYQVQKDIEIIREYYYTAVHYAKIHLSNAHQLERKSDIFNNAWFMSNQSDLLLISSNIDNMLFKHAYKSKRQERTIDIGREILVNDLNKIRTILGF